MNYELKLDLDKRNIQKQFAKDIWCLYRVYYTKRNYLPEITINKVDRTRKGWHIYISFHDEELIFKTKQRFNLLDYNIIYKLLTLQYQAALSSDKTRGIFDTLRILHDDNIFNVLFDYKKGRHVKRNKRMKIKLQKIVDRIRTRFASLN